MGQLHIPALLWIKLDDPLAHWNSKSQLLQPAWPVARDGGSHSPTTSRLVVHSRFRRTRCGRRIWRNTAEAYEMVHVGGNWLEVTFSPSPIILGVFLDMGGSASATIIVLF